MTVTFGECLTVSIVDFTLKKWKDSSISYTKKISSADYGFLQQGRITALPITVLKLSHN